MQYFFPNAVPTRDRFPFEPAEYVFVETMIPDQQSYMIATTHSKTPFSQYIDIPEYIITNTTHVAGNPCYHS